MKKRMKILFIANVDWYFNLHWLNRSLAAKELFDEVHISFQITNPELTSNFESMGFIVHPIKLERKTLNPIKNILTLFQIKKLIEQLKPDYVHAITVKPNLLSGLICKKLKINQTMSITGLGRVFSNKSLKSKAAKLVTIKLYSLISKNNSNKITFENNDDLEVFSKYNIATTSRRYLINGAGVDTDEYKYSKPLFREEVTSSFKILFAARMLYDKGLENIISAVDTLKELNITIDVAGILDLDSDNAISLNTILQWHEEKKINWLGSVEDVKPYIYDCDIVCLPTKYGEGVPRILIESASCGRPLITTGISGCRDIVINDYNGFTIPVDDSEALAKAIKKLLLSYPMRVSFGKNGRKLVEDLFSQKIVLEKTIKTYEF